MRRFLALFLALLVVGTSFAQSKKKKFNLGNRAGDHLMFQLSSDHWSGMSDSVTSHIKGSSRGANLYVMLDKPFHGDQRFSAAFGLGVSTSSMFFKRMTVDIASNTPYLPFYNLDTMSYFKKYKLTTAYLELPIELRFTARPDMPKKSFKFAIGAKVGTLLNVHSKGKSFLDKNGNSLSGSTQKTSSKSYFNNTKLAVTARIGMGNFTLFGAYNITTIFKDNVAPDTKLLQVGLTFSGL